MRHTSQEGCALLKVLEGVRLKAYKDSVGVWTIGYGTTEGVHEGMEISLEEAEALFLADLRKMEVAVNRLVKVPLTQLQFDALMCWVYNVGVQALRNSNLLKRLNAEDYDGVDDEMRRWVYGTDRRTGQKVKIPGLINRRAKESALWIKGCAPAVPPVERVLVESPDVEPWKSDTPDIAVDLSPDLSMNPIGEPQPLRPVSVPQKVGATAGGVGAAGAVVMDSAQQLQPVASFGGSTLQLLFAGLTFIGVGLLVWSIIKRRAE